MLEQYGWYKRRVGVEMAERVENWWRTLPPDGWRWPDSVRLLDQTNANDEGVGRKNRWAKDLKQ